MLHADKPCGGCQTMERGFARRFAVGLAMFCGFLSCVSILGCTQAIPARLETESRGEVVDIGPVLQGDADRIEREFRIANTKDAVLKITGITKSCTCTTVKLEDEELEPGEETTLHIAASLDGRTGPFELFVRLDVDSGAPFVYKLKTHIYEPLVFDPKTLHLGGIEPGEHVDREVSATTCAIGEMPGEVVLNQEPQGSLQVTRLGSEKEAGRGVRFLRTRWKVSLVGASIAGRKEERLSASVMQSGVPSDASLTVNWFVQSDYVVEPGRVLVLGSELNAEDTGVKRTVVIRHKDGAPVKVTSLKYDSDKFACNVVEEGVTDGTEVKLLFEVPARSMKGFFYEESLVYLNDELGSVLAIPVAGAP